MTSIDLAGTDETGRAGRTVTWPVLAFVTAMLDAGAIVATALIAGHIYYRAAFGSAGSMAGHLGWGATFAIVFVLVASFRGDYGLQAYLRAARRPGHLWVSWTITFAAVLTLMFLLKSSVDISRGATVVLYAAGFIAFLPLRLLTGHVVARLRASGRFAPRRLLVVGRRATIAVQRLRPRDGELPAVTEIVEIDGAADPATLALDAARRLQPDDILIAVPWSDMELIEALTDALVVTPAAIRLAPERGLRRYAGLSDDNQEPGFLLVRAPLGTSEVFIKRGMDLVVASLALVVLAPVLALVALLIKLDSAGPVLFRQTRHGFNQSTFRVFKFRSMSVMEDGAAFTQARRGDTRVTRVGYWLRRTNIDELPQILNVLTGDMSIVGPRPHPVALNDAFDSRIAHYSRRHVVRPGITGWAQVHGLRGETDTEEKMRARVAYDLAYLKNWSFWLDCRIILMTLVSRASYRNAF
ncbi:MAG: exopolysaccharide biosynthesis polyprenyl glycosylphosphotransferase [Rhizobiales bacterium]|nr:exopolysaccharide biosynthesis polyprenyl glycosylphosphotransferase [Hyphomicrobiales bacterium]